MSRTLSATNSAAATASTRRGGREEVFVATVPLRASKGLPQLLMSAAYSLSLWDLQHFMVLIKPSPPPSSQVFVYDFQPKDPEDIYAALSVLSGRPIPGVVRRRELSKLPRSKCWFVGTSKMDAVDLAGKFNNGWKTELMVGHHDCRNYTNGDWSWLFIHMDNINGQSKGLVECLTGEKYVLERLRSSTHTVRP